MIYSSMSFGYIVIIVFSNYMVIETIFQGIMRLNEDVCEQILCSESYQLGNINVNIFHLAGRYGLPLQVQYLMSINVCCKVEMYP